MRKNMVSRSLYTSALTLMMIGATNFSDIPINTFVDNNVISESMQGVSDENFGKIFGSTVIISYAAELGQWEQQSTGEWKYRENGSYATGWKYINGKWYYMYDNGIMASNCWISGLYYVGSDGAMLESCWTPDGYYVGSDGAWVIDYEEISIVDDKVEAGMPSNTTTEASASAPSSDNDNWWEKHLGGTTENEDGATDHDLSVKPN